MRLEFSHLHMHWAFWLLTFHILIKIHTAPQIFLPFSFVKVSFHICQLSVVPSFHLKIQQDSKFLELLGQKICTRLHSCLENLHSSPSPHHRRSVLHCPFDDEFTISFTLTSGPVECEGEWQPASCKWRQSWRQVLRGTNSFCPPYYT